ncbi:MAG: ATP-dependent dethiobiotin synthetase BioD [Isosphaeraceae bacterium]|jgi:dethiobiotin synthetase|nr:MAG: ATP-dependent dethiobiotin synthetase BioD [Isosphaeraceae bacterium]
MTRPPGLFIVATDTGVGKTRLTTSLIHLLAAQGRRVGAFKPVATGSTCPDDRLGDDGRSLAAALATAGLHPPASRVVPLLFAAPLAPPVAARLEGRRLDYAELYARTLDTIAWWEPRCELILLEGIGGLHCPIAEDATLVRLAVDLDYPLLIVARRALGTLNHTLCTVEVATRRGLRIAGIVLNQAEPPSPSDPSPATNRHELARLLPGIGILAELDYNPHGQASPDPLQPFDWQSLARPPRLPIGLNSAQPPR